MIALGVLLVAVAQRPDDFAASVRAATAPFRDQQAAIEAGYRQVGPDFPSMGQHWVNPALLVAGSLDPAHPQVLEYVDVAGRPMLVGVAYAVLVTDTTPPAGLPVPAAAWHTHSGSVDDESFVLSHSQNERHHHAAGEAGPRIAILHAWVWVANPDGLFETDNWALPFIRRGFAVPAVVSPDAGRGLALAIGGSSYFRAVVRVKGRPDPAEQARLDRVLSDAAEAVARQVSRRVEVDSLAARWREVWGTLLAAASPDVRRRLAALE